ASRLHLRHGLQLGPSKAGGGTAGELLAEAGAQAEVPDAHRSDAGALSGRRERADRQGALLSQSRAELRGRGRDELSTGPSREHVPTRGGAEEAEQVRGRADAV